MKKKLSFLLAAILFVSLCPAVLASYTTNPTGTIVGTAPVYEHGGLLGEQPFTYLYNGSQVVVQDYDGNMRFVFYFPSGGGIVQGWVDKSYIRMDPSPQPPTPVPVRPTEKPTAKPTARPTARPTSAPHPTADPYASKGVVVSESVNLRADPSTHAKKITSFKNGAELSILAQQGEWYYVSHWNSKSHKAEEGWVYGGYVAVDPWHVTTVSAAYAYAMPAFDSVLVGQIASGTSLLVIGEFGDFYAVNLRSASAFIHKNDVR